MPVDGENRVRHILASFKLDGLRKRHAATLLHSRLTIKGHSARIFVERDGDVRRLVKFLILFDAFREIGRETTILLVEQNFLFARSLGRGVAVIDDGRIIHRGQMAELAADEALQTRLLSLSLADAH